MNRHSSEHSDSAETINPPSGLLIATSTGHSASPCPQCGAGVADGQLWLTPEAPNNISGWAQCDACGAVVRELGPVQSHKFSCHASQCAYEWSMDGTHEEQGSVADGMWLGLLGPLSDEDSRQWAALGGTAGTRWVALGEDAQGFVGVFEEWPSDEEKDSTDGYGWSALVYTYCGHWGDGGFDPDDSGADEDSEPSEAPQPQPRRVLNCSHGETLTTADNAVVCHISADRAASLSTGNDRYSAWPMTWVHRSMVDSASWSFAVNVPSEAPDSAHGAFLSLVRDAWQQCYGPTGFGPYWGD
jgi:hypothetical protein